MQFDINIPIQPHIRKYLLSKFNSVHDQDYICISSKNKLGLAFVNMFQKRNDIYRKEFEITFTSQIRILFSGEFSNRFGFFISKQNIFYLNKALDDDFRDSLYNFLDGMREVNRDFQINRGILQFCSKYRITEDDIALETLRKSYQRYRKELSELRKAQSITA